MIIPARQDSGWISASALPSDDLAGPNESGAQILINTATIKHEYANPRFNLFSGVRFELCISDRRRISQSRTLGRLPFAPIAGRECSKGASRLKASGSPYSPSRVRQAEVLLARHHR